MLSPPAGNASRKGVITSDGVQAEKPSFVFIEESGSASAKSSKDKRRAIRSQAKRYAIAERSKQPRQIRFVNVKGTASDVSSPEQDNEETEIEIEFSQSNGITTLVRAPKKLIVLPDLPKKGYEQARIDYGFDIFLLSGLASVHVGKGASLHLHETKLGDWLRGFSEQSYLDHVPQLYNSSPLLQSVVNCTMAQYKRAICPAGPKVTESTVFRLYGTALKNLQTALNNDKRRLMPDVLLATAVLQLFELLQNETSRRWSYHTLGLMHLLQMRDPSTLTNTELSLLGSQLGPLLNECFLRQIDCFAEEPQWEPVLLKLQRNNKLITTLLVAQSKLGRFIRIAGEHIRATKKPDDTTEKTQALLEMHDVKEFTYQWEEDLQERKRVNDPVLNLRELPCAVWSCRINLNRIMIALDPLAGDARVLEEETQELAERIMDWWNESAKITGERDDRLYTYPIPTAQIVIATKEEWMRAVDGWEGYVDKEKGTVDGKVFEAWTTMIKSKAPTRKYKYVEFGP